MAHQATDATCDSRACETLVFVTDPEIWFGDSQRVLPARGAVVGAMSSQPLAEAVAEMYRVERGAESLPLTLVSRRSLSVTQVALAMRELDRAQSIGSYLGDETLETRDATFARIGLCAIDLARLADELRPVVSVYTLPSEPIATHPTNCKSVTGDMGAILRTVERHRLMFLFWAAACRRNPLASGSQSGVRERVRREDIRGWKAMCEAIDSEGTFLWTFREVLDRYAEDAISTFGPMEGSRPTTSDASGRDIFVEGGTYPYWSLDEESMPYLEQTSDAILEACRAFGDRVEDASLMALVRETAAAARPDSHPRWYTCILVKWSYLSTLDDLIARIKVARAGVSGMSKDPNTSAKSAKAPDAQSIADLVVLLMVCRDVHSIGIDYPDAIPAAEHREWVDALTRQSQALMEGPDFESLRTVLRQSEMSHLHPRERCGLLMAIALQLHPSARLTSDSPVKMRAVLDAAMQTCQNTASDAIQEHVQRLANVMVLSCRAPTGTANADFAEAARALQLLHQYWTFVSDLVHARATCSMDFVPHPLLQLIENLRDRLNSCFRVVAHLEDAESTRTICEQLIGLLTEGEIDDLAAAPEWTIGEIQKVECFVARSRLRVGPKRFVLTKPEEFFIAQCNLLVAQHVRNVRESSTRVMSRIELARNASAEKLAKVASATAHPHPIQSPSTDDHNNDFIPVGDLAKLAGVTNGAVEAWAKKGENTSGNSGKYRCKRGTSPWLYNWRRWNAERTTSQVDPSSLTSPAAMKAVEPKLLSSAVSTPEPKGNLKKAQETPRSLNRRSR